LSFAFESTDGLRHLISFAVQQSLPGG
jgi:hypothetical protein